MQSKSSWFDNFVFCQVCGKKLFKVKYGSGIVVIKCRGCHKEITVPFGNVVDKEHHLPGSNDINHKK